MRSLSVFWLVLCLFWNGNVFAQLPAQEADSVIMRNGEVHLGQVLSVRESDVQLIDARTRIQMELPLAQVLRIRSRNGQLLDLPASVARGVVIGGRFRLVEQRMTTLGTRNRDLCDQLGRSSTGTPGQEVVLAVSGSSVLLQGYTLIWNDDGTFVGANELTTEGESVRTWTRLTQGWSRSDTLGYLESARVVRRGSRIKGFFTGRVPFECEYEIASRLVRTQ